MSAGTVRRGARVPWRALVLACGLGSLAYGGWQLLGGGRATNPVSSLPWLAGSLVVHDGVLAPLAVLAGAVLVRMVPIPAAPRRVLAGGLFVAACLVLVAIPALGTPGVGDNPTATPRDYPRGLAVLLAVVAVATLTLTATRWRGATGRARPVDPHGSPR
jgi:hypothetical protein